MKAEDLGAARENVTMHRAREMMPARDMEAPGSPAADIFLPEIILLTKALFSGNWEKGVFLSKFNDGMGKVLLK